MRRLLASLLLVLGGIGVGLGAAEGLVRVMAPYSRDHVVPSGLFEIDSMLGWRLRPDREARHHTQNFDVVYSMNSAGFRDAPPGTADAEEKVLFFGDSQIFGWGVAAEQRVSDLIEMRSPSTEVLNMAVPGYGLDQEILSYERDGRLPGVTGAIFFVSRATVERTTHSFMYRKHKPMFTVDSAGTLELFPVRERPSPLAGLVYRALSPFYLPYFLETHLTAEGAARILRRDLTHQVSPARLRLQIALLRKARAIAADRNHRMIVLASLPLAARKELKDFCDRNDIVFVGAPWPTVPLELVFSYHDRHWIPRGHELVAAQLLASRGAFPGVRVAGAASLQHGPRPRSLPSRRRTPVPDRSEF